MMTVRLSREGKPYSYYLTLRNSNFSVNSKAVPTEDHREMEEE